mmetsp:Transcript_35548/g.120436  ORF Transcript_35548/g.120436 Transcript_35548/m.120436 type:complete len:116 (+) Transcript_35548:1109-1456(+)
MMISCLMPKKFHAYSPPLNIRLYSHAASSAKAVWITVQQTRNSHVKQDESANVEDPKLRRKVGESRTSRFQVCDVKQQLKEAIILFDVTDMLGYDPTTRQVPMTDAKHCAHCECR